MNLVVALNSLGIGGTESYALTVAEQLDRLGHRVWVCAAEMGKGVAAAEERALSVISPDELPPGCEAAIVQDAAISLQLAELRPRMPQLFVCHSESVESQSPSRLGGLPRTVVALNDRVARRLRAAASEWRVVRLTQPIDTERFRSRGALPETPRRALALSNNLISDRRQMLEDACSQAGIELIRMGGRVGQSTDPRSELAAVDLVIGFGRSVLEGMACGRAAYVYDAGGGDGWVTPESYPAIEADGFGGRTEQVIDAARLAGDLRAFDPSMGPVNRDLIVARHRANVHAQELVDLLREAAPTAPADGAPLAEMARLVRLEWRARGEVHGLLAEAANLREQLGEAVQKGRDGVQRAEIARAEEVAATAQRYEQTLSWQLTAPLRVLSQLLRRLRGR